MVVDKINKRARRHRKIKNKITSTTKLPRLSVFRSCRFIYAQIIDDKSGKTLVSASDKMKGFKSSSENKDGFRKVNTAKKVGKLLAENAKKAKIDRVVFDRGGFTYSGRVKALAEGAREGGLKF